MSNQQTIYADQEQGLSDGGTTAAIIANFATQIIPKIFGGGNPGAENRDRMRRELEKIGFTWIHPKGGGPDWNIDNFPDISLMNLANATAKYGQIVAELHNQQKFNKQNTQTMQQIESIVRENGGTPINNNNSWGGQQPSSQTGYNNTGGGSTGSTFGQLGVWPMVLLGAGALGLVVSMRNSTPVAGKSK